VYTLDTNAIIYYLNGDRAVMQSLEDIIDQGAPRYVSTITVLELFSRRGLSETEKDDIGPPLANGRK
jgi:predicted nucleic acid-binding protein